LGVEKVMSGKPEHLRVQRHGDPGRTAVVLHGGPGAPGSADRLARALANPLHVLEPWQRWSSNIPLTVEQHVEDLADVISQHSAGKKPALVGESWGAMLALAFASRHPDRVSALVLIGCGTFDPQARARLWRTLEERTTPELKARLADLEVQFPDEAERVVQVHGLSDPLYTYCRAADADDAIAYFDLKGHLESFHDMVRLQESGAYPAAFSAIECPVLMLHGTYDPHPGAMIRDSLEPHMPHLEYREFDRCGHTPWVERYARDRFLAQTRGWLEELLR
jgi:pimeloyl-ACP methyl ester carboxylesterase